MKFFFFVIKILHYFALVKTQLHSDMISVFKSKSQAPEVSYVENLVRLAAADGILDGKEVAFIKKLSVQRGVGENQLNKLLKANLGQEITVPETKDVCFDLLYDLVELMYADGVVADEELVFCSGVAEKMGFNTKIVDLLVAKIERGLQAKSNKDYVKNEAEALINY